MTFHAVEKSRIEARSCTEKFDMERNIKALEDYIANLEKQVKEGNELKNVGEK